MASSANSFRRADIAREEASPSGDGPLRVPIMNRRKAQVNPGGRVLDQRRHQACRLSTCPAAIARTSCAWSRSFWLAYSSAKRAIAVANFGPFPM